MRQSSKPPVFDAVQAKLDANARRHNARPNRVARAPLTGRIFDIDGQPMSPSFTHGQRGQVYRYYVSAPLQPGRRDGDGGAIRRVPEAGARSFAQRGHPAHCTGARRLSHWPCRSVSRCTPKRCSCCCR